MLPTVLNIIIKLNLIIQHLKRLFFSYLSAQINSLGNMASSPQENQTTEITYLFGKKIFVKRIFVNFYKKKKLILYCFS